MSNAPVLFSYYPDMAKSVPFTPLGHFPTPVKPLKVLGDYLGLRQCFIKCDSISGPIYGGNKVRKLEFLLGDALAQNKRAVLTFGAAGSNHALATSLYAKSKGLHPIVHLFPQPNSEKVRQTLRLHLCNRTEVHAYRGYTHMKQTTRWRQFVQTLRRGHTPLVIPGGGTTPLGALGFVSAAFELKEQIERGFIPEPDVIYIPLGTMGTAAGLAVGLEAAGLKTRICAVQVVPDFLANETALIRLYDEIIEYCREADSSFPELHWQKTVYIDKEQLGEGYAEVTAAGSMAVKRMAETESIELETTYTGKTVAALIKAAPDLKDKCVLYWNTYNSVHTPRRQLQQDISRLPARLRAYF